MENEQSHSGKSKHFVRSPKNFDYVNIFSLHPYRLLFFFNINFINFISGKGLVTQTARRNPFGASVPLGVNSSRVIQTAALPPVPPSALTGQYLYLLSCKSNNRVTFLQEAE